MLSITRSAPIVLPVAALIAAIAGIWSRIGSSFGLDNILFAMIVSGLIVLPSLVFGVLLSLADAKIPKWCQLWFTMLVFSTLLVGALGFWLGRGSDF